MEMPFHRIAERLSPNEKRNHSSYAQPWRDQIVKDTVAWEQGRFFQRLGGNVFGFVGDNIDVGVDGVVVDVVVEWQEQAVLRPLVERMIVTFGALHADAEKDLGGGFGTQVRVAERAVVVGRGALIRAAPAGVLRAAGLVPVLTNTLTPPDLLQYYLSDSGAAVAVAARIAIPTFGLELRLHLPDEGPHVPVRKLEHAVAKNEIRQTDVI